MVRLLAVLLILLARAAAAASMVTLRDLVFHRTGLARHDELWFASP